MTASLRFGRVAGIPVGASWSALLIALLIAWGLAGQVLPAPAPGLGPGGYWLAGLAGAGLFLGSLLAHEVGHALVARRAGLRVRGITLWLLGGGAQLADGAPAARAGGCARGRPRGGASRPAPATSSGPRSAPRREGRPWPSGPGWPRP